MAETLLRISPEDTPYVVKFLVGVLERPPDDPRWEESHLHQISPLLAELGPAAKPAVPVLINYAQNHRRREMRRLANAALVKVDPEAAEKVKVALAPPKEPMTASVIPADASAATTTGFPWKFLVGGIVLASLLAATLVAWRRRRG